MILDLVITVIIIIAILIAKKYYFQPKNKIQAYKKHFQSQGYKVYQFPYKLFTYPIVQTIYKDSQKGDAFYSYKNIFCDYDVLIGNQLFKPSISLFHPQLRLQFAKVERNFVFEKFKGFVSQQVRFAGNGVIFSEGDDWKKKRRIMSSLFTHELIRDNVSQIAQICLRTMKQFQQKHKNVQKHNIIQYDIGNMASDAFSQVIVTLFMGLESYQQRINGIKIGKFVTQLTNDANMQAKGLLPLIFGIKFLDWGLTQKHRQVNNRLQLLENWCNQFIDNQINKFQSENNNNDQNKQKKDILSLHMQIQNNQQIKYNKKQLIAELKNFVIAGTDTSTNLFRMMVYYISQNPQVQLKLRQQIVDIIDNKKINYEKIKNMKYLQAIVNQTIRMYGPTNHNFPRRVLKDFILQGIPIYKQTIIQYHSVPTHYNKYYYWNPHKFQPQRWLDQNFPKSSSLLVGFGLGPRNCIGQHLALAQTKIAIILFYLRYSKVEIIEKNIQLKWKFLYKPDKLNIRVQLKQQ